MARARISLRLLSFSKIILVSGESRRVSEQMRDGDALSPRRGRVRKPSREDSG